MNWKNIKTFLILLFLIINIYLIFLNNGFDFKKGETTYTNEQSLSDTVDILKNNFNVILDKKSVPSSVKNLNIINVTNIIYTNKFKKSGYKFKNKGSEFECKIKTDTFSYNEENAKMQITEILKKIGVDDKTYKLNIKKTDEGLVCLITETVIGKYNLFNGNIRAVFNPSEIILTGSWYIAEKSESTADDSPKKMQDISNILIKMAYERQKSDLSEIKITDIDYGYYVSYYDETKVSKSSSAIPCFLIKTDDGSKYYYDATNSTKLKQED